MLAGLSSVGRPAWSKYWPPKLWNSVIQTQAVWMVFPAGRL